jgi:hypothetical protein
MAVSKEQALRIIQQLNESSTDAAKPVPHWLSGMLTARELCTMTFKPLKFIVPGILPEGLTILAGRPKIGKSWLTLLVGIAVANGVAALGQDYGLTKPIQGEVLYLALEDGPRRLQRRMIKILGGARAENWPGRLHLKTDWRRFDQGGLEDIRAWHVFGKDKGKNPTLVIIDTLAKIRAPGNPKQSPYQNDHDALAGLQKLAEELGIAIIVTHHDRKMAADDVFDTLSGTLGLTGAVDTILVLTKKGQERTLHVRGRDIEEEASLAMNFNPTDCRWSVVGTVAQRDEQAQSAARAKVLDALKEAGAPMGIPDIMLATETDNRNAVDLLLGKMFATGQIKRVGRGLYCHPDHVPDKQKDRGQIGQKERLDSQSTEIKKENGNLSNLSNLSGDLSLERKHLASAPPAAALDPGDIPPFLDRRPKPTDSFLSADDEAFLDERGLG